MTTPAQAEANRRNARHSTGPKTPEGKAIASRNALKHGRRAAVAMPVLPQEDPRELEQRVRAWLADYRPATAVEADLVARAARLSWQIERHERAETAHLAARVRAAQRAAQRADARRLKKMHNVARMLLSRPMEGDGSRHAGPHRADHPAVLLRALEETAEGCRWLLDQWAGLLGLVEWDADWTDADRHRMLRLLGKEAVEAIYEPELNATFLAWDALEPGAAGAFFGRCRAAAGTPGAGLMEWAGWRLLVRGPADRAEAVGWLSRVVQQEMARVQGLLSEHERRAEEESAGLAELAAYDPDPGLDRLRRSQAALARELHRALELLLKLRKAGAPPAGEEPIAEAPEAAFDPGAERAPAAEAHEIATNEPIGPADDWGGMPREDSPGPLHDGHPVEDEPGPEAEGEARKAATNEPSSPLPQPAVGEDVAPPEPDEEEDERTHWRRRIEAVWPGSRPSPARAPGGRALT